MQYCKKCVMPSTRPGTSLDESGVCLACRNYESRKDIDWDARWKQLEKIAWQANKKGGVLIPVSGGKDSYYLNHIASVLGLKVTLFRVADPFGITKAAQHNIRNMVNEFNVPFYQWEMGGMKFRDLFREQFLQLGNFPALDMTIYSEPIKQAYLLGIPLVLWGENSAYEYGTSDKESRYAMGAFNYCQQAFGIKKAVEYCTRVIPVYASYFVPWSGSRNYHIAVSYGFKNLDQMDHWNRLGTIENYDSLDEVGWQVSHFLKYRKFGFGRATDIASRWIREGGINREEAIVLVNREDHRLDPVILEDFLRVTGFTEKEFWDTADRFTNRNIFCKVDGRWAKKPELEIS